ncbi:putative two-component system sensor protein [Azoarcus olearius]|uniref:sensor histidine kinase n=1 Tax=Azoarcus sp. (strain BH72) TaxID=418699 RepID=UPI000806395A|nr:ATP-binding protein [Azoarcus olearius]ANQ85630.1 putative two-component system sensor protein [Azoarcus olearius]
MSPRRRFILQATAAYAVLTLAWILISDRVIAALADVEQVMWLSSAKGVFYVVASSVGVGLMLRAVPPGTAGEGATLLDALTAGLSPDTVPRWVTYLFAGAASLIILVVRERLLDLYPASPMLVLFMLPITLSALFGGAGPGLLATLVAAVGVAYPMLPVARHVLVNAYGDVLDWGLLVASGLAVCLLSEVLRRSIARVEVHRRLLDTIISGTSDAIFVKDTRGRYLLANAAMASYAGDEGRVLLGQDDTALLDGDSAAKVMKNDREIMLERQTRTLEEQLTTRGGRPLAFLVTKGPVLDDQGRAVGVFGIGHEITERKRAEAEIRDLNADLERRVGERTAELQSANRELEDLAYALTHNLRAPLRAINGFARLLLEGHAERLNAEARDELMQIQRAGSRMGDMLNGILALLRSTGKGLTRTEIDLSALALRRMADLREAEPERRLQIEVEPGLVVHGDPEMLQLAVLHLIDNAWKFTRGRNPAVIRLSGEAGPGFRRIYISDNGVGFDMAHAQRLFNPFQRLHREDEFQGLGIGLATVQRILRRHGGDIEARGAPGEGATFCIYLPDSNGSGDKS